ncbi:PH domain-containing protein [Halocatena pleomorpha]|uniref:PH domain-containing protein n=1 Tax=Halocatena pleomorpha TaxID=1785090 RepID=A0A3P3RGM4_9EURY|nr:PH domain-containing protein [Halocatena pleomorpha]RRJ32676.1 PH domain-containing protein [Halocatena pleomorpha]
MSSVSALSLDAEETVHWTDHPRLMLIVPDTMVGIMLVVVGITVVLVPEIVTPVLSEEITPWFGVLVLPGIALPAWSYLVVVNTVFVITDRALYVKRGVFSKRVDRIRHSRVQNSSFSQGYQEKILGYGTVSVDTAGVSAAIRFYDIDNPESVRERIDAHASEASETEIPGSIEQWNAVLEEVQALRAALESN